MNIEIKDLPNGRNIKNLKIEVEFEEENVKVSTNLSNSKNEINFGENKFEDYTTPIKDAEITPDNLEDLEKPKNDISKRESKELPAEMINQEF